MVALFLSVYFAFRVWGVGENEFPAAWQGLSGMKGTEARTFLPSTLDTRRLSTTPHPNLTWTGPYKP